MNETLCDGVLTVIHLGRRENDDDGGGGGGGGREKQGKKKRFYVGSGYWGVHTKKGAKKLMEASPLQENT